MWLPTMREQDRQRQILRHHPAAIVDNSNKGNASLLNRHINPARLSIQCVFQQFLHDTRWPFNHFASGDSIDNRHRECLNSRHSVNPFVRSCSPRRASRQRHQCHHRLILTPCPQPAGQVSLYSLIFR